MKNFLLSFIALTILSSLSWADCQKPCVVARYRVTKGANLDVTLFTPKTDGMFRVSLYIEASKLTPPGTGVGLGCIGMGWTTDYSGQNGGYFPNGPGSGQVGYNCVLLGQSTEGPANPVITIFSKAMPIRLLVFLDQDVPPGAEYALSAVVERLSK